MHKCKVNLSVCKDMHLSLSPIGNDLRCALIDIFMSEDIKEDPYQINSPKGHTDIASILTKTSKKQKRGKHTLLADFISATSSKVSFPILMYYIYFQSIHILQNILVGFKDSLRILDSVSRRRFNAQKRIGDPKRLPLELPERMIR